MIKLLRSEWPHITPDGALVQTALPDWRAKTTDFIAAALGSAQRAAFKGSAVGANDLERLESEGRFLSRLALDLKVDAIRVDEAVFLNARSARREHEAAGFLRYEEHRAPGAPPPIDLRGEIDSLMRDGMDLVEELSEPVQPEKTGSGSWKVSGSEAPNEWWDKSDAFFQKARTLLKRHQPALLKDFEQGFNRHFREQEERLARANQDHREDKRSTVEKMLAFANAQRGTPREVVEATLNGLTEARRRLGN